jgi:hypothetical protein
MTSLLTSRESRSKGENNEDLYLSTDEEESEITDGALQNSSRTNQQVTRDDTSQDMTEGILLTQGEEYNQDKAELDKTLYEKENLTETN